MAVSIVRLLKYEIENVVCTGLYWKAEPIARHNTTAWMQMHIILAAVCIVNWLLAALFEWAKRIHEQKQRIHSHLINELNQVNWQKKDMFCNSTHMQISIILLYKIVQLWCVCNIGMNTNKIHKILQLRPCISGVIC